MKIFFTHHSYSMFKKLQLLFIVFLASVLILGCQKEEAEPQIEDVEGCLVEINGAFILMDLDVYPEYLDGGSKGFVRNLSREVRYPAEAREKGIEGRCELNYEITTEGRVEAITLISDPGGGIGAASSEALMLVTEGITYSPAQLNGNPVRVRKGLVIKFKLEN